MKPEPTTASPWVDGIGRHLDDLRHDWYEGASGAERHGRYLAAFELLTPVARDVLQQVDAACCAAAAKFPSESRNRMAPADGSDPGY